MTHDVRRLAAALVLLVVGFTTAAAAAPQSPQTAPPAAHTRDSRVLGWFLKAAGPCPNCDPAQTLRRTGPAADPIPGPFSGRTVFPSPLAARHPATRDVRRAPGRLDPAALPATLTWPTLHNWLLAPAFRVTPAPR